MAMRGVIVLHPGVAEFALKKIGVTGSRLPIVTNSVEEFFFSVQVFARYKIGRTKRHLITAHKKFHGMEELLY